MKKILAILMTICLLAGALSISTSAALLSELDAVPVGTVLRVSAHKGNSTEVIKDYDNFEDGWNYAMGIAGDEDKMKENGYSRIIVDIYADWKAADDEFGSGDGFDYDTIYIPEEARVTVNLNNYTIDRDCSRSYQNGEVICIADDADVIINGGTNGGTITGGFSHYSAGGIYIKDDAKVTLNNVHVVDNISQWDGGGITVSDGSTLTMNGGSLENNTIDGPVTGYLYQPVYYGGAVYVEDATAIFDGVEFKDNNAPNDLNYGAAIYAVDSEIVINKCIFDGNGIETEKMDSTESVIHSEGSTLKVTSSTFTNNGGKNKDPVIGDELSAVFKLDESELVMDTSEFSNNSSYFIIVDEDESLVCVSNTKFLDNAAAVMYSDGDTSSDSFFNKCTFNNNVDPNGHASFYDIKTHLTFYNCSMGNSTFNVKDRIKFVNYDLETNAVLRVSALKTDGTTVVIDEYQVFDNGWNAAMELADDHDGMNANGYDRIVVDLLVDWNAIDGKFTDDFFNGDGFNEDTIYFQDGVKMTLNLNGHTINRGLKVAEENGEVIYIDENADVIINDGTITGGWSARGAGGIHIMDGAKVTLNNVNVNDNAVLGDDGAGIAVYDGAILIMNEGSVSNNRILEGTVADFGFYPYGTLYVCNATAILSNVTFDNNYARHSNTEGVAIYATGSSVTMDKCVVSNNSSTKECMAQSIIAASDSKFVITNTDFIGNAEIDERYCDSYLLELNDSILTMEGGKITGNKANELFNITDSEADIKGVSITDNASVVIYVDNDREKVNMIQCTLNNNTPTDNAADIQVETKGTLTMTDCEIGDTTFNNKDFVILNGSNFSASIFGEGSLSMIIAILSLIASGVAIFLVVYFNKKKAVPATANNAAESNDEE